VTDAEFEVQKERIEKLIDKWVTPLGLRWWHIDFVYCMGLPNSDEKEAFTVFEVTSRWYYMESEIRVNMLRLPGIKDDNLEDAFVHELSHILVNETRADGKDWLKHEERVCTALAKAFIWTRSAGQDDYLDDVDRLHATMDMVEAAGVQD
jgi:hypothetical protein